MRTLKRKAPRRAREPVGVSTTELSIQIHDVDTRLAAFIAAIENRQHLVDAIVETLARILRTVERMEDAPSRESERTLLIEVRRALTAFEGKPPMLSTNARLDKIDNKLGERMTALEALVRRAGDGEPFTATQVVGAIDAARATRSDR